MQKSRNYYRRQDLLRKLEVPTMTEVKEELGERLAGVVFQECPNALKQDMGLEPKLKGPGPNLWTSPSDLLIGKVCLKPPLTDKHIKALTHEGILAIGYDIEMKYWKEMELEKQRALAEQAEHLQTIADRIKRVAVKMARDEEIAECERRFSELSKEFQERLREELDRLEHEMLEYQQKVVHEAIALCEEGWQLKLDHAVQDTVQRLTKQFLEDLEKQKKELEDRFRSEFEHQQVVYDYALTKERDICKTTMKQLRHCLECKNLANLMYVLCMERRKCGLEQSVLEYKQKVCVEDLNKTIDEQKLEIERLTEERDQKQRHLEIRELCVLEILKQFQKFINYALRATLTQAEFLLDVRKMMLFEITQAMVAQDRNAAPHLARQILSWRSDSESISSAHESESSRLTLPDYHECLDEIIHPSAESDFLPSFYYHDKLYVNRNLELMAGKGIEISETNALWNRDVENLMKILKTSVKEEVEKAEEVEEAEEEQDPFEVEVEELKGSSAPISARPSEDESQFSQTAKLHLNLSFGKSVLKHSDDKIENPLIYCNLSGQDADKTESNANDFIKRIIQATIDVEVAPLDTTGLLAARDSLVVIRESRRSSLKEMVNIGQNDVETNNMLMAVKESLEVELNDNKRPEVDGSVNFQNFDAIMIPDQLEIKRSGKSSKSSIYKNGRTSASAMKKDSTPHYMPKLKKNESRESKLLSVKDSLIFHRNSLVPSFLRKSLPTGSPQPQPQPQPQKIPSHTTHSRRESIASRVSMARDSLELMKKQSILSKSNRARSTSNEEVNLGVEIPVVVPIVERKVSPLTTSHIEVAQIPVNVAETAVNFSPIAEIYEVNVLKTSDSPWKIYEEPKVTRDNFLTKPNELNVIGDPQSKEHLPGSPSFTVHRINSIMNILRQDSSLMRLFTSGTK